MEVLELGDASGLVCLSGLCEEEREREHRVERGAVGDSAAERTTGERARLPLRSAQEQAKDLTPPTAAIHTERQALARPMT